MSVSDDLANLQTRRAAICAELAAGQTPDGQSFRKPVLSIDGESVDTVGYKRALYEELKMIREELQAMEASDEANAWEDVSEGTT